MADEKGLSFLFDIQDKISCEARQDRAPEPKSSAAKNIDKALTRSSKAQEANLAKITNKRILRRPSLVEERIGIKASEARTKAADAQGKILVQRLSAAQANAARLAEKFRADTSAKAAKAHEKSADTRMKACNRHAFKRSMTRTSFCRGRRVRGCSWQSHSDGRWLRRRPCAPCKPRPGRPARSTRKTLSAQAREMGRTTVHSATEAARGQAFLAQAGFDANEILAVRLPATLALATAGELDLASAADIASNVLIRFPDWRLIRPGALLTCSP